MGIEILLKKVSVFVTIIAISVFFSMSFVHAQNSSNDKVIKVGYVKNYGMINDSTSLSTIGYGYDYLKNTEYYSDLKFEFIEYSPDDFLDAVDNQEFDIYGPTYLVDDPDKNYLYTENSIGQVRLMVVAREGEALHYADVSAFEGKTVATFNGNIANDLFEEYADKNNIEFQYTYGTSFDYTSKQADFFLVSSLNNNVTTGFQLVLNLGYEAMHFSSIKGDQQLIESLDAAIENTAQCSAISLYNLYDSYFGESYPLFSRGLSEKEQQSLENAKFTVGFLNEFQPYHFLNADGQADGISIDIFNHLAGQYGFDVEYQAYDDLSEQKDFDIVLSVAGTPEDFYEDYIFSNSYHHIDMVYVSRNSVEKQARDSAEKIGISNFISFDYNEVHNEFPDAEIIKFDNFEQSLVAYQTGKIDTLIFCETLIEYVLTAIGKSDNYVYGSGMQFPLKILVSKDIEQEYMPAFETALYNISDGTINDIELSEIAEFNPKYLFRTFLDEFWYVILVPMLIIMGVVGYYYIRKENQIILLNEEVFKDQLTEIFNRKKLDEISEQLNSSTDKYAVLYLDLDKFKEINDIHGHEVGDKLLVYFTKRIKQIVREDDMFIRIGGDEFIIIVKDTVDTNEIINLVSRLEWSVLPKFKIDDITVEIETSIGYAIYPNDGDTFDKVLLAADEMMYQDKKSRQEVRNEYANNVKSNFDLDPEHK